MRYLISSYFRGVSLQLWHPEELSLSVRSKNQRKCLNKHLTNMQTYWGFPRIKEITLPHWHTFPFGMFGYRRRRSNNVMLRTPFKKCMMSIFHELLENGFEIFVNDFSLYGDSVWSLLAKSRKNFGKICSKEYCLEFSKG